MLLYSLSNPYVKQIIKPKQKPGLSVPVLKIGCRDLGYLFFQFHFPVGFFILDQVNLIPAGNRELIDIFPGYAAAADYQ